MAGWAAAQASDSRAHVDVRLATSHDLDPIRGVFHRSSLHEDADRAWLLQHPHHLVWRGDLARTWVAVEDGVILGFASWEPLGAGRELVDLFVDPAAMRRGVGRRLVEHLGAPLEVTGNPTALPFYLAVGFEVIGEVMTERVAAPRLRYRAG